MRKIFVNNELESAITDNGFVIVKNLIPEQVCEGLNTFFNRHNSPDTPPFNITNWTNDIENRKEVYTKVVAELLPFANAYLLNYKPVMAVYAAKKPGLNSDMKLHQDWSLVDETRFRSVSMWVALCDMDQNNGNLQVARKSHLYAGFPRGMHMPVPFENIKEELQQQYLTDLPLSTGDAVIFDHRLVHCSPQNTTDKLRLAAVLALIPTEAELIHYYQYLEDEGAIEVLKMKEEAFHLLDFFDVSNKPGESNPKEKIPFSFKQLSIQDLMKISNELL